MKEIDTTEPRRINSEDLENEYYPNLDYFFKPNPDLDTIETTPEGWFAKYMRLCEGLTMEEVSKLSSAIIEAENQRVSLRSILLRDVSLHTLLNRLR